MAKKQLIMKTKLIVLSILIVVLIGIAFICISFLINRQPLSKRNFWDLITVTLFCYLLAMYLIYRFISLSKTYDMVKGFQEKADVLEICEDALADREFEELVKDDHNGYTIFKGNVINTTKFE